MAKVKFQIPFQCKVNNVEGMISKIRFPGRPCLWGCLMFLLIFLCSGFLPVYALSEDVKRQAIFAQIESELGKKQFDNALNTINRALLLFKDRDTLNNLRIQKAEILFGHMGNVTAGYEFINSVKSTPGMSDSRIFDGYVTQYAGEYTRVLLSYLNHLVYQYFMTSGDFPETLKALLESKSMNEIYSVDGWGIPFVFRKKNPPLIKSDKFLWYDFFSHGADNKQGTADDIYPERYMSSRADESVQLIESKKEDGVWRADIKYFSQAQKRFDVKTVFIGELWQDLLVFHIDDRRTILLGNTEVHELTRQKP